MAGIYVHIPFCKQPCSYCNFYFTTSRRMEDDFFNALHTEILQRKNELNEPIDSIYYGGGSPSLVDMSYIEKTNQLLFDHFEIRSHAEITLEANPDDLTKDRCYPLYQSGINRLSIGIQSFHDEDLALLNRAHSSRQALSAIEHAQEAGFDNITVDLIYGIPGLSNTHWIKNLDIIQSMGIPHVSCYALTVEEKTPLFHQIRKGKTAPIDDNVVATQFNILMEWASTHHYDHYEISNFAQAEKYARHNTSYWNREPYLGLGPSAHSFSLDKRRWNISNLLKYIQAVEQNQTYFEKEALTKNDMYNEYMMVRLRTKWGVRWDELSDLFGNAYLEATKQLIQNMDATFFLFSPNGFTLSNTGKLFADRIASDFFMTETL